MGEENKQKTFRVERNKINDIISYFNKIGNIYDASIELQNNGEVKIKPYHEEIEVMCNCQPEIINELEEILKK